MAIVLSVLLRLRILITPLVSFGHCVLLRLRLLITPLVSCSHCCCLSSITASDYPFGIFWPLCCLSSSITDSDYPFGILFVSIVLSVLLRFTDSDYPFGIFCTIVVCLFFDRRILITPLVSCGHCVVCPSSIFTDSDYPFGILWPLLSVLLRFTDSDYPFGILWPLCCLSSSIYGF